MTVFRQLARICCATTDPGHGKARPGKESLWNRTLTLTASSRICPSACMSVVTSPWPLGTPSVPNDEEDHVLGRGWAVLDGDVPSGTIFVHLGDESGSAARRSGRKAGRKRK